MYRTLATAYMYIEDVALSAYAWYSTSIYLFSYCSTAPYAWNYIASSPGSLIYSPALFSFFDTPATTGYKNDVKHYGHTSSKLLSLASWVASSHEAFRKLFLLGRHCNNCSIILNIKVTGYQPHGHAAPHT